MRSLLDTRRSGLQSLAAAAVAILVSVAVAVPSADAQALYGSIVGTVVDATDAPLPGATVTVVR